MAKLMEKKIFSSPVRKRRGRRNVWNIEFSSELPSSSDVWYSDTRNTALNHLSPPEFTPAAAEALSLDLSIRRHSRALRADPMWLFTLKTSRLRLIAFHQGNLLKRHRLRRQSDFNGNFRRWVWNDTARHFGRRGSSFVIKDNSSDRYGRFC